MRHFIYSTAGVGLLWATLTGAALAGPTENAVSEKLATQQQWLGSGPSAQGWKAHLLTKELEEQLAKGSAADKEVVRKVLTKYQGDAKGLDRPQFVAVREALAKWLTELSRPSVAELPAAIAAAKTTIQAPTADQLTASREKLQTALSKLDTYLARGGAATVQGWHTYLELPKLQAQLSAKNYPEPAVLRDVLHNFYQNKVGLERAPFVAVREALRAYADQAALVEEKDLKVAIETRLDDLTKLLAAFQATGSDADAVAIGQHFDRLRGDASGEALAQAIRSHYMQPNFYLFASQRLASAGVKEQVNDVSPVHENILDTDIRGTAHTVGQVSLRTVPSSQKAIMDILMSGQAYSRNVGRNGPVTIYTNGLTNLSAYKRVVFDETGLHAQPAVAVAETNNTVTGIGAKLKIVRKIAEKQIAAKSGQADLIASQRAERRLERRIDAQASDMLAKTQDVFDNKFRLPLLRKGHFPEQLKLSTTADGFRVVALHATSSRLGSPSEPPKLVGQHDLAIRIHESLAGNAGETILGGLTLTDEKLAELLQETTGNVPEELRITEDKDPWSITFSDVRPISVVFTGNTVTIAIHGKRFTRGDQEIKRNMLISAKYKLEPSGNGSKLTREGDVNVEYVDIKGQLSISQVGFKTFLRSKFSSLFKPEIANDGLKLPGRWERAGKLVLRQMEADKGWLTLGWEQPEEPRTAALPTR